MERAPRGEKLPKRLPNGLGAAEAKTAALHPERYQSSLFKLYKGGRARREKKRRQSDWLANQIDRKVDRQVIDRQIEDRQTGRDKVDAP